MKEFIGKCIVVTYCVATLLYFFYPRYETINETHCLNKITGKKQSNYDSRCY